MPLVSAAWTMRMASLVSMPTLAMTAAAEPGLFGPMASDPTVSRLIDTLAATGPQALRSIRAAQAEVRNRVWRLAGSAAPNATGEVIVDLDGVLVLAHSEKQDAAATWKRTYGHHPLMGFVDHGSSGRGEPVAGLLRPSRGRRTSLYSSSRAL